MDEQPEILHANRALSFSSERIFQLLHLLPFSLSPALVLARPEELKCVAGCSQGFSFVQGLVPGFGLVQILECLLWKSGARFKEFVR